MPNTTPDEARRVEALRQYRLLDTAPEQAFDDCAALAGQLFGTPIALVLLIDETRAWVKAGSGLGVAEAPRTDTFCEMTLAQGRTMVVPDALEHPQLARNRFVIGEPHIRFYAGTPLCNPAGHALGAICVAHPTPRHATAAELAGLEALARQVTALMEYRRVSAELSDALASARELSALLPMCAWCKQVRDDAGYWGRVEEYLSRQAWVRLSHGMCPSCFAQAENGG